MRTPTRPRYGLLLALILSAGVFVAVPALAQGVDMAAFASAAGLTTTASITVIIARLIRTAITLTGIVTVAFIVYGGFIMMTAGGNAERVKRAKNIIINAIIGLLLVFASFAITQFILNALTGATGADISGSGPTYSSYADSSGSSVFSLSSVNTTCAQALQNLQLQFVFSKRVASDTVAGGILIEDSSSEPVEGVFVTSGRSVTFTPSQACAAPYEDEFCFDALSTYTITMDPSVLESTTGSSLTCTTAFPCLFSFTTGSAVDVADPSVNMDVPDDGESLYAGSIELLQALTTDDSGVSTVDFYVIDDDEAIYSSGVDFSNAGALVGGGEPNAFFSDVLEEWDTSGYTTNEEYDVWARGNDCAGNTDTASRVTIMLRAGSCNNDVQDVDLGETDVDCGGDSSSVNYCGACEGDECSVDADCSSSRCIEGTCVVTPKIESVFPGDGAVGNLVTIAGEGFGAAPGTITFIGTTVGYEIEVDAYVCNSQIQWSDDEIIVAVPSGAKDGPMEVTTSGVDPKSDATNDDYGPSIADFDVNAIQRPGICQVSPNVRTAGNAIGVFGNSFGDVQGSSTFYFTNYETSSYLSWSSDYLQVLVPNVNSGNYRTQVFTGDFVCVKADGTPTAASLACAIDADCDTLAGESCATAWCSETLDYCADDEDCAVGEGSCESIRVGSNKVAFTVLPVSSSTRPVISSIDSGWKACSDDDTHCGDDDDCNEEATCDDALNWGPPGQYITVYGTGFGSATGSLLFKQLTLGYTALGDVDFPDACGEDFWHDTFVTVKVPETYQTASATPIVRDAAHVLTLVRADAAQSDPTDFLVLDDTPGPALCDIDPSAGPADTEVTVYGENFGNVEGSVTFYSLQEADVGVWENTEISSVVVPGDAVTGPVRVQEAENGYSSNSVTFSVGDCREDAALCVEGQSCCVDGSCSILCEAIVSVASHYAFRITTGITPNTPRVIVSCTASGASPSPWEGWSEPEDVCVNAAVEAEFNMAMNTTTINPASVLVRKCTSTFTLAQEEDQDEACSFSGLACNDDGDCVLPDEACVLAREGECKTWGAVAGSVVPDTTGFSWTPSSGALQTATSYRVSLQGVDKIASAAGGFLEEDYVWEFTTSATGAPCQVGSVNVRPLEYTQTQQANVVYSAQLIAANDRCVALSCAGYTVGWGSDFSGARIDTAVPGTGICTNTIFAQSETPAEDPAIITATVTNAVNHPFDRGELTINFVDPKIEDYFPQCTTACVNALPWGEFNTVMSATSIGEGGITLYSCANSLCAPSGLTEADFVDSVSYSPVTRRFSINFETGETMVPNTWYRVYVDGYEVMSQTGVMLSRSGSNYGTDENRYFAGDFSWIFKTKNDAVSCAIDSVSIDPELATMSYVGERAPFDATGAGAPDNCSAQGQTLQSGSYEWDAWTAVDNPNNVNPASGSGNSQANIVAYMILDGAIELTTDIPNYCTSACLRAGASLTTAQGVCGNGVVETSEECDDGATVPGDGCSASCLNEGVFTGHAQCPYRCSDSSASCTTDASCEESCVSAQCSSALDVNEACTNDLDCDSGSCSDADACEDYEDADTSCSNNGVCDSGSCVGSCSISLAACSGSDVDCPYDTGGTCELSGSGCCGDGVRQAASREDCDDGNLANGDGCSAICLDEGSRSISAVCGDGVRDWVANTGGEDCDDGNSAAGDGCSRNCLREGSAAEEDVYAICGNGILENGEDCDSGNYAAINDGCSSSCLREGTLACPTSTPIGSPAAAVVNCCGNGIVGIGEECDSVEGCSSACLWSGSSYVYSTPSFCGDGDDGIGEECDALASALFSSGDYGVAQVATGAPVEVDADTGYAVSSVSVTVDGDVSGDATLQLQCSCSTDLSCGGASLGCGESNCCYERPTIVTGQVTPADNIASTLTIIAATTDYNGAKFTGEGYCRNTAVWLTFSETMDETTFDTSQDTDGDGVIDQSEFDANLYLDLVSKDSNGDGILEAVTQIGSCPAGYVGANPPSASSVMRLWNWLKALALGLFGQEASASSTFDCHVPVTYQVAQNANGSSRVYLRAPALLEANAVYRLTAVGDQNRADNNKDGVLSQNDVTLCLGANCVGAPFTQEFAIGEEICDLDRVLLEDTGKVPPVADYESASIGFFSATDETHAFVTTPQTYRTGTGYEEIASLPGLYAWNWAWSSSIIDTVETDVVAAVSETPQDTTRNYTASGNDGLEIALATATITNDALFTPTTAAVADDVSTPLVNEARAARTVEGTLEVTALLCENPWPSLTSATLDFPYLEDDLPSNFSFYYCRDEGEDGTIDDLPALEDPIEVTSLASSGIIQELIFKVAGAGDAIGVRVVANPEYLTPGAWVEEQEFTGSFSPTELDGYPAVAAGNTLYAAAANVSGSAIYPNIYIISYNENAGSQAQEVFARLLAAWRFNGNVQEVTNVNLCQTAATGSYRLYYETVTDTQGEYVSCQWDGDCFEKFKVTGIVCDAQKGKLTRDMQRLLDVNDMVAALSEFGDDNGHCELTKGQSCREDYECPGTEECVAGFPTVQSGTFVPALSNSIWSSWNASLANELGSALPTDPLNEFYNCAEIVDDVETGYDAASCWNGEVGAFVCPDNSHLYGYQSVGGEAYLLYAQLETSGNYAWQEDIDMSATDEATVVVEYPMGNAPSIGGPLGFGFSSVPVFCNGGTWGDSTLCGDGTQGVGEVCEIGDTTTGVPCSVCVNPDDDTLDGNACTSDATCGTDGFCADGTTLYSCAIDNSNQCFWNTAATAACIPFACGNGVVETGEACDDGSLNGTYGNCSDTCSTSDALFCGDGYLAGSEACDCGTTSNYLTVVADSSSWAYLYRPTTIDPVCSVSNGQYLATGSCAYNCALPGPSCGDARVNGSEACDGGYEQWTGALCADGTACVVDDDCSASTCGAGGSVAGIGDVCTDYVDAGDTCTSGSQCDSDSCLQGACTSASDAGDVCAADGDCESDFCPDFNYPLFRYRTCTNACAWDAWAGPVGGTQICGNGITEGNEACDDGNSTNNDSCLNTCVENVCGDDFVYIGVESCDDGDDNGDVCVAPYGGSCNYCNATCQYKTTSGGYCGDGLLNGSEICDGAYSTQLKYYDSDTGTTLGSCAYTPSSEAPPTSEDDDGNVYTCRWLGACDGGPQNGELCTLQYATYLATGDVFPTFPNPLTPDLSFCGINFDCVPPVCADNCGSSCPTSYATTGLLVQSSSPGAPPNDVVNLYSYQNELGDSPDSAVLYVPACNVATQITADVDNADVELPDVDIVFVTDLSGSMGWYVSSSLAAPPGSRRIDYVVEATQSAVSTLFDAAGTSASMQIALVSFTNMAASLDVTLSTSVSESLLLSTLDDYLTPTPSGSTPTYTGVDAAVNALADSDADVKIVVLLSDGEPTNPAVTSQQCAPALGSPFAFDDYPALQDWLGVPACVAQIAEQLIDEHSDILFYSAAVTTSPALRGYMAHLSSNSCVWSSPNGPTLVSDCDGSFAYQASDAQGIADMYEAIVNSIVGTNITLSSVVDASTSSSTVQVSPGADVELPLPDGFACATTQQTLPLRNTFYGTGAMEFSDFQLTYCPAQ